MTPADIRAVRKRLGYTQAAFGRLLGKSRRTVTAWEAGEIVIPDTDARLLAIIGDERCPAWVLDRLAA